MAGRPAVEERNRRVWARGRFVNEYATGKLRPVESAILDRYAGDLGGRVLELGTGAGRLTGHLLKVADAVEGVDISPAMVAETRRHYPKAQVREGDLADLSWCPGESFDAVWAGWNVLDIFREPTRRMTLREVARVLRPGGLFVFSSHNRAYLPQVRGPLSFRRRDPLRLALDVLRAPLMLRRHRALRALEETHPGYAMVSDGSHRYRLVHYYIARDAQLRQLEEEGFEPLECLDLDGRVVEPGAEAPGCSELHYLARRPAQPDNR